MPNPSELARRTAACPHCHTQGCPACDGKGWIWLPQHMDDRDRAELQRSAIETSAFLTAIASMLVEKGICTVEEMLDMKTRALAAIDQEVAAIKNRWKTT